jgi:Glycosyltransferase family 87
MSARMRLAWFGAIGFVAIFGLGELVGWIGESLRGPSWWAIDLQLVLDAGARLGSGQPLYADPKFLYPPLAAVVGRPLALLDPFAISLLYAALKVVLAVIAVRALTPGWRPPNRVLAVVGLVCSLPFLHDVMLGNANVLLVGAMAVAVFARPTPRSGVLLGLAAAIFAKPLLAPLLLWLLVFRRPVFAGAVAAGLAATAAGVLVAGLSAYVAWTSALAAGSKYAEPFAGNHGLTALAPTLWAPVAVVTATLLAVVLARRGPRVGLASAAASGILLAPYVGTYGALPVALALPAIGPLAPGLALLIVAVSPVATTHPLPFYAAGIMLASLALRERRAVGTSVGLPVAAPLAEALE